MERISPPPERTVLLSDGAVMRLSSFDALPPATAPRSSYDLHEC